MSVRIPKPVTASDVDSEVKRETERLTAEMYNAIRRHSDTCGVNYTRPTLFGGHGHASCSPHDRRPVYSQLSHININFPGSFLPTVCNLPKRKNQGERIIRIPVVFSRSKTTLTPTIRLSNSYCGGQSVASVTDVSELPQSVAVTDLAGLRLEDYTVPKPVPGYLHLSTPKARYMDYFTDDQDSDDSKDSEKECIVTPDDKTTLTPVPVKCFVTQSEHQPPVEIKTVNSRPASANAIHLNRNTDVVPNRDANFEMDRDAKQQRSILKSHSVHKDDTGPMKHSGKLSNNKECAAQPTSLQRPKSSRVRSTRPTVIPPSPRHSARSKPGGAHREFTLTSLLVKPDERKRCVRFNAANEIREYAPSEPVCF